MSQSFFNWSTIVLAILAIYVTIRLFHLAKKSEKETSNKLNEISIKTTLLSSISENLINNLTKFSTYGLKEHIETILKYTNQSYPPRSEIKQLKKTDTDIDKLFDTYIRYYYVLYKLNFYAPTSNLIHSNKSIEQIANTIDESYSEFFRIDTLLEECDKTLLKNLSNYDLYVSIRNLKDNMKNGSSFFDIMKLLGKYPNPKNT